MKFPTIKEMAEEVAEKALDEFEYKGKTLRQWIEIIYNAEHGTNLASLGTDAISREQAIETFKDCAVNGVGIDGIVDALEQLPPIQPEITHEQAIDYLHSTGWMQEHDRQMMLDGAHRLTAHPEIIRCRNCKFASGDSRICMKFGHSPIGELDFCSFAERREVTT